MMFGLSKKVDVRSAQEMAATGEYVLVDVRTVPERRAGHPPGSMHITLDVLEHRAGSLQGKKVLAICRSGNRSNTAARFLNAQGIEALNVSGGMLAWARAGLPITKGS